jgi:hypothetical protein
VDPQLLRAAFRIGFLILGASLLVLPFEDRGSAEFVVTVLAVVIGFVFVALVTLLARSSLPPAPRSPARNSVDKAAHNRYNGADSHTGGDR